MKYNGTPGRIRIVPVDQNNLRIDLDTGDTVKPGTYNSVTVDSFGRIIAGTNQVAPTTPSGQINQGTVLGVNTAAQGNFPGLKSVVLIEGTGVTFNILLNNGVAYVTVNVTFPYTSISYAGPPTDNPPVASSIVVDVNGRQWQYFGGAWN